MDDFILIHYDKEYLKYCISEIEKKLSDLKLKLNNKTKIYNLKHGVNFLGYKFKLVDKKLSVRDLYKNKVRIIRRLKALYKNDIEKFQRSLASYLGYISTNKKLIYILEMLFI